MDGSAFSGCCVGSRMTAFVLIHGIHQGTLRTGEGWCWVRLSEEENFGFLLCLDVNEIMLIYLRRNY